MNRKEQIKNHVKRHKTKYVIASYVAVAGITVIIMKRYSLSGGMQSGIQKDVAECNLASKAKMTVSPIFLASDNNTVNATFYNEPAPKLSYIVRERGTDNWWESQADLSKDTGISETRLSRYFNHGEPLASNREFDRVGIKSAV